MCSEILCVVLSHKIPQTFSCIFYYKYTKNIKTDTITWLVTKHHTAVKTFIKPPLKASVINYLELIANLKIQLSSRHG